MAEKKKSRGHGENGKSSGSLKDLGGRKRKSEQDGGGDDDAGKSPDVSERASSGLKAADHLGKAAGGGKLRQAFSLWRASHHLRTAAAGTGELVKQHPALSALIGGVTTGAAIYVLATRAAVAGSDEASDDDAQDEGEEDEAGENEEEDAGAEEGEDEEGGEDDA